MKKYLFMCLVLAFACQDEEITQRVADDGCYLSEVTSSNLGTYRYFMEDDKLLKITYDGAESNAIYTYNGKNKLTRLELGGFVIQYTYNNKDQMIRSESIFEGTLVSTLEYEYDANGFPKHSLSITSIPEPVQSISETDIEYLNGNPVKYTTYLYNSTSAGKGDPLVTTIIYDDKKNPYNTIRTGAEIPMKNNGIEYNYVSDPESKTIVTYTYNEDGYPITYNRHYPNRTDNYPDVNGTYTYDCSGN